MVLVTQIAVKARPPVLAPGLRPRRLMTACPSSQASLLRIGGLRVMSPSELPPLPSRPSRQCRYAKDSREPEDGLQSPPQDDNSDKEAYLRLSLLPQLKELVSEIEPVAESFLDLLTLLSEPENLAAHRACLAELKATLAEYGITLQPGSNDLQAQALGGRPKSEPGTSSQEGARGVLRGPGDSMSESDDESCGTGPRAVIECATRARLKSDFGGGAFLRAVEACAIRVEAEALASVGLLARMIRERPHVEDFLSRANDALFMQCRAMSDTAAPGGAVMLESRDLDLESDTLLPSEPKGSGSEASAEILEFLVRQRSALKTMMTTIEGAERELPGWEEVSEEAGAMVTLLEEVRRALSTGTGTGVGGTA